jgi:hypothetical protein
MEAVVVRAMSSLVYDFTTFHLLIFKLDIYDDLQNVTDGMSDIAYQISNEAMIVEATGRHRFPRVELYAYSFGRTSTALRA